MDPNCKNQNAIAKSDRLSSLPDDILVDILSLLPNIFAVSSSVLSTRWRFLWTHINSLDIDCQCGLYRRLKTDFCTVVDRLLYAISPSPLRSFTLHAPYLGQPRLENWLTQLCSGNVVEDINITVEGPEFPFDDSTFTSFTLPSCVFQTRSLVSLDLSCSSLNYDFPRCDDDDDDDDVVVCLPSLRKLGLEIRASQCGFFGRLVRSCPLLEDLNLSAAIRWDKDEGGIGDDKGVVIDISCENLKRLRLELSFATERDTVVIDAPRLVYFGLFASSVICSFVKKPMLLQEARIGTLNQVLLLSILPMIVNVRVLHLFGATFDRFEGFNSLIFRNLMELTLNVRMIENFVGWDFIQFESTSSNLLRHVKKINVIVFSVKDVEELETLTEYLFNNALALERLAFVVGPYGYRILFEEYKLEEMRFCIDLYYWSRNASHCLVEFHGQYAKLPTNIAEVQEMENQVRDMSEDTD